ncbi:MAG: two-component regulator propeller domain-containing protein, partial [Ignavibacteriaceae bacterium]
MFWEWLLHQLISKSCIIYLLVVASSLFAQGKIRFDNIDLPDIVNNKYMHDIFQDSKGYIWFANWEGLNRYDGYELKTFELSSDRWPHTGFHYITEDEYGFLWASPYRVGVFRFNPALEKFEFFNYDTTDHSKRIHDVYADKDGFLWIISEVGLYSFKPPAPGEKLENIDVLKYVHNPLDSTSLSTNAINTIIQDKQRRYWIGTKTNGIDILYERVPDGKFVHYSFSPYHNSVAGNNINEIFQDCYENIWIGTQSSGISIIAKDSLSDNINFINYSHDKNNPYSLLSNTIFKIVQTKNRTIWISVAYGLQKVESKGTSYNNLRFDTYTAKQNNPVFLNVNEMCPDKDGRLWISKFGTGIAVHDPVKYKFHHYKIPDSRTGNNVIISFFEMPGSNGGKVWLSTDAGLYLFDRIKNKFIYKNNRKTKNGLINTIIRLYQSRFNKNVWVGCKRFDVQPDTIAHNAIFCGFKKFDPYTGLINVLNKNARTLQTYEYDGKLRHCPVTDVYDIEEISEKYIVLATDFGIALYDQEENKYIQKPKAPLSNLSNINGEIIDLLFDSKMNLWISVTSTRQDNGLFRFNLRSGELRNYLRENSGLQNNRIYKIVEDSKGDIWFVGGALGLLKYIDERDSIIFYDIPKVKNKTLSVENILKDDNDNLWLSGMYLTKFNIE